MRVELEKLNSNILESLCSMLVDPKTELPEKYNCLFALRNASNPQATTALVTSLNSDKSNLLRHDVAFCLGQKQDGQAVEQLINTVQNSQEHYMVRHEAAEALAAIGDQTCLQVLQNHINDSSKEVSDTCYLALEKLKFDLDTQHTTKYQSHKLTYQENKYNSIDPTPAYPVDTQAQFLDETLSNDKQDIFLRYGALFALRNKADESSIKSICRCLLESDNALLKHEVAYVLGQLQDNNSIQALCESLADVNESAMVRHEAAEALGSIANQQCIETLIKFSKDVEPIVADSCKLALAEIEWEN